MSYEEFVARLPVGVRKNINTGDKIEVVRYPLASVGLTEALGGGIAAGRISLIYGNQSAGKTMLTLQTIGKLQKELDLVCAFFDVEGTFEPTFAEALGVDTSRLIVSQARSVSKVTNEAVALIEAGIDLIAIDSISAIMPDTFLDQDGTVKDAEDRKQIGAHSKAIKNLISGITYANEKTAIILLSQTTTKIETWGAMQVPHGGQSPLFSASQIVRLTSSNTEAKRKTMEVQIGNKKVKEPVGRIVDALVEKNKLGRQSTTTSYDIYYAGPRLGIDFHGELVDSCIKHGVITQAGSWFSVTEEIKLQGRDEVVSLLREDEELFQLLKKKLDEAYE